MGVCACVCLHVTFELLAPGHPLGRWLSVFSCAFLTQISQALGPCGQMHAQERRRHQGQQRYWGLCSSASAVLCLKNAAFSAAIDSLGQEPSSTHSCQDLCCVCRVEPSTWGPGCCRVTWCMSGSQHACWAPGWRVRFSVALSVQSKLETLGRWLFYDIFQVLHCFIGKCFLFYEEWKCIKADVCWDHGILIE